jgi:hypothetical protein
MIVVKNKNRYNVEVASYEDIEADLLNFSPGVRVLPAPFYNEPSINFILKRRHEPGEPGFPDGGFSVYGPSGEVRAFDINQVIVHPYAIGKMKFFDVKATAEQKQATVDPNAPKRKRGRPSNPDVQPKAPYVPTGGKRGRPANPNKQPKAPYVPTGGKRGRPKKAQ